MGRVTQQKWSPENPARFTTSGDATVVTNANHENTSFESGPTTSFPQSTVLEKQLKSMKHCDARRRLGAKPLVTASALEKRENGAKLVVSSRS